MSSEESDIQKTIKQRGSRSAYMEVLVGLAGTVQLDEKSRDLIFGIVLGTMNADVASRSARPYQYLLALLSLCFVGYVIWSVWFITNQQWNFFLWMFGGG